MKKKRVMIYMCLILFGCTNHSTETTTNQTMINETTDTIEIKDEKLAYMNTSYGYGTNDGFYHITQWDSIDGTSFQNIRYFDYGSKKEIFLCDKPECDHMNETCTSYLPLNASYSLFSKGDYLYLIQNVSTGFTFQVDGSANQAEQQPALIYQMDKDGKNRKLLCELKDEFLFEFSTIALGNNTLYIPVSKNESVAIADNSYMTISTDKKMIKIDLSTGEQQDVLNMKDKFFVGADGTKLLFQQLHYQEDIDALLARNDYDGYDNAILNADVSYSLFNILDGTIEENFLNEEYNPCIYNTIFYYINQKNELCKMDSTTKEIEVLETFKSGFKYVLHSIVDGHLQIDVWSADKNNSQFLKTYIYTLAYKTLTTQQLVFQEPKEPFIIIGYTETSYFMKYKQDGHMETTWANTQQFTPDYIYYGLINKEDYWNDKATFSDIASLSK